METELIELARAAAELANVAGHRRMQANKVVHQVAGPAFVLAGRR
jgi:hypothetical protein